MTRTLWSLPLCAVLLSGCPDTSATPQCGDFEKFNLTNCQTDTLAQVNRQGAWNYDIQYVGPVFVPGSLSLTPGQELLDGRAVTETKFDGRTFFLSTRLSSGGHDYRFSIAGCGAIDANHFGGQVALCDNGTVTSTGLVTATRITRAPGEAESSGLTLVSESKVRLGSAVDVEVSNGYAYVSALTGGMTVFDVRQPAAPVEVSQFAVADDFFKDAKLKGDTLYVASFRDGIALYDVSNPAKPVRLGSTPVDKPIIDNLFIDGDRLYAAASSSLQVLIYDIHNPRSPVLLSRFLSVDAGQDGFPHDMFASGNRLYISHWALGLVVVDVTDPTKPKQLGSFQWPFNSCNASQAGQFNGKTYAFVGDADWNGHLRVIDVTDPAALAQVAELPARPEVSINNLVLVGNKLYASSYQDGVRVFDVSDPVHPALVKYFNTWRGSDPGRGQSFYDGATRVRVPGDGYLYSTESSRGLLVFREN